MTFGLGGEFEIILMEILKTTSTDPNELAAIEAFNYCFSITFELGVLAILVTMIALTLSRS